jgi:hypothetical protein
VHKAIPVFLHRESTEKFKFFHTGSAQSNSSFSTQGAHRAGPIFHTGSVQSNSSFSTQGAHRAIPVFPHREHTEQFQFFHTGSAQSNSSFSTQEAYRAVPVFHTGSAQGRSSFSTQGAHRAIPVFPHREHTEQFQFFHTGRAHSSSSFSTRGEGALNTAIWGFLGRVHSESQFCFVPRRCFHLPYAMII